MAVIPIIDLFAGPGGLGEGFSAFRNPIRELSFRIALSIEKEPIAHQTLRLRSFVRQFRGRRIPKEYYMHLRGECDADWVFDLYSEEADASAEEAWCAELGVEPHEEIQKRISSALRQRKTWLLIGGPPCQAYSLVGRSRIKNGLVNVSYEEDPRHHLYEEYLRILADHAPPVFLMENVKGILSSNHNGERIFEKILKDLREPRAAVNEYSKSNGHQTLSYSLFPLESREKDLFGEYPAHAYIVRSEEFGIPQARHRVFVLGIRSDLIKNGYEPKQLEASPRYRQGIVDTCIGDLPRIRSGISKRNGLNSKWHEFLLRARREPWIKDKSIDELTRMEIDKALDIIESTEDSEGAEFISDAAGPKFQKVWFQDQRLKGYCNHTSRRHLPKDLYRYLFASAYAKVHGTSPKLTEFPEDLLPDHRNVDEYRENGEKPVFDDRFRVQVGGKPSSTITSHISKDGHYYIHPDPSQCRSLTVREAARLQTFPDNYFFEGPRTSQYVQVGNAVPPLLANRIAAVIYQIFKDLGLQ